MMTILVTGPIGSGKSELCKYLASRSYPVYDCDSRTKMLYSLIPGLKCRIEEELGVAWEDIRIIFSDEDKRRRMEAIVYPYVVADLKAWKSRQDSELLFVESAIALEKPQFDGLYDKVLLVSADYAVRENRNAEVAKRDALQHFDMSRVDYEIRNDSTLEELYSKTDNLLCRLI